MLKPILFNTEMVRAILDGRKTVTRRVVKPQPKMPICYYSAGYKNGRWGYPARTAYISWGNEYRWPEDMTAEDERRLWNPPCHASDILWVRETWQFIPYIDCNHDVDGLCHEVPVTYENADSISEGCFVYRADYPEPGRVAWKPSIHMPKDAARIFLHVTEVRAERLQDITGGRLQHEGVNTLQPMQQAFDEFAQLWDSTIKHKERTRYGWRANPLVWVIEFERCEKPKEEQNHE